MIDGERREERGERVRESEMSTKKKGENRDEVEELLRAAEEEMLLKLSVDSHMSRVSPSYIDPDLQRRFQALKNPSSSSSSSSVAPTKRETTITATEKKPEERDPQCYKASQENDELNSVLGDDLFARFAALKAAISSPPPKTSDGCNQFNQPHGNSDDDEDDEVEKVIQWAIDAARLDPSSPTDDDDDENDEDGNDDSDDNGDRVGGDKRVKGK